MFSRFSQGLNGRKPVDPLIYGIYERWNASYPHFEAEDGAMDPDDGPVKP